MKNDKKILKIAAFSIMIFFIMASAAQAGVDISSKEEIYENGNPNVSMTGDNYVWEDHFNNAQKIQLELSENFIVKNGHVEIIDTYPQWTDPAWERMKIVSLTSQVSGEVAIKMIVDYDTDMKSDYGDVRFKFEGDNAWLNYWIEEKNPEPSDPYAIFWVKVEDLPTGSSEMYMFYMNENAYDESDYWAVFDEDSWNKEFNVDEQVTYKYYKEGCWDPDACYGEHDGEDVFLITWEEGTPHWPLQGIIFEQQIRGRYYDLEGNAVSNRFDIVDEPDETPPYRYENPSGKYGKNDKFFVAYEAYNNPIDNNHLARDIEGAIVDTASDGASERFTICSADNIQADPCVAYNDDEDEFLVVWEDARYGTSNYDIYGRLYQWDGDPVGSEFVICSEPNTQCEPWVTYDTINHHYLVVWEESTDQPNTGPFEIWGQLLYDDGGCLGDDFQISEDSDSNTDYNFPTVAFCELSERFLVAWQEDDISDGDWNGPIWGKILNKDGNIEVDIFEIAGGQYCRTDIVPYLSTSFFVSYDNWVNDNNGDIWGKMVNDTGSVNEYTLKLSDINDNACDWANIASDGNKIYVCWEDVREEYPYPFDNFPDVYFNIWSLNIPTGSDVTYSFGDEISMILDAHIVSKEIIVDNLVEWVLFDAIKTGDVDFDLLDGETLEILIGDMSPGASLDGIEAENIRLKARFHRDDPSTTPTLDYWKVEYIGEDKVPPLTQVQERDGVKGKRDIWVSDGVIIWLMAQDFPEDTGSGVKATYYTVNNEPTTVYNEDSGIQLSVDSTTDYLGEFDVYFWSEDNSGNVESPPKYEFVKIDAEIPSVEITYPTDDARVAIPFWIKAEADDNDRIDYVDFNIEPYEKRPDIPVFYPGPYEWECDVEHIPDARTRSHQNSNPSGGLPQPADVAVHIRARAWDMSGQQSWISERYVIVTNWEDDGEFNNVEKVLINKRPLFGLLKLGFAFGNTLNIEIPTPQNADYVKFEASNIFGTKQSILLDIDISNGCSASFDFPTGLYRIAVTSYKAGEEINSDIVARVFFMKI